MSLPPIQVAPPLGPRGMIVTDTGSSASGCTSAATVCPASCHAVMSRSCSVMSADVRARPMATTATASWKHAAVTSRQPVPGGGHARLVDDPRQIGAAHAGGLPGDRREVDVGGERLAPRVDAQHLLAAAAVRRRHLHLPVEPAGPGQRGVQQVGAVRRGEHDDPAADEAVHLVQQGDEGVLALAVPAADSRGPRTGRARRRRSRR